MTSTSFRNGTRKTKAHARRARAVALRSRKVTTQPAGMWFSIADAALMLGVSATTVRRRANAGEWSTRKALTGKHTEVLLPT